MKKVVSFFLAAILLFGVVVADSYSISQEIPFCIINSTAAKVYGSTNTNSNSNSIKKSTICQIEESITNNTNIWYKVRYFQDNNEFIGYIQKKETQQMSLDELIRMMSDTTTAQYMQNFVGFSFVADSNVVTEAVQRSSPSTNTTQAAKKTYILNTNTKVFHLTGCSSVKRMSDKNKKTFTGTRTEVINKGYRPCNKCNP